MLEQAGHLGASGTQMLTADPVSARSHLARRLTPHEQDVRSGPGRLHFEHQEARLSACSLHLLTYGAEVTVTNAGSHAFYLLQLTIAGECQLRTENWEITLEPGMLFVLNPNVQYRKEWSRSGRQLMVKIPLSHLARALSDALGPAAGVPDFTAAPMSALGNARHVTRLLDYLCRDLRDGDNASVDAGIRRMQEETLVASVLRTFPHQQSHLLAGGSPAAPSYLLKAERHVRENFRARLSIEDIASVAGVSASALREAFGRYRKSSPLRFVQNVRLHAARLSLTKGAGTVSTVAFDAGFAHLGRFSRLYRQRFGELPSETLKKALPPA